MLSELRVRDLGVIEDLSLVLGPGLTAVTGETGAGKTLVVEALALLAGGRADAGVVRRGAKDALVEGRFLSGEDEVVLSRVVPVDGRSRGYVDGAMATAGALAERAPTLLDLHGQGSHQSLMVAATQRSLLDAFARIDSTALREARARRRAHEAELASLGGDEQARAREVDLLRHQLGEIEAAALEAPDEEDALELEEDRLADAVAHREAASETLELLAGEDGARDDIGRALAALGTRLPLEEAAARLRSLAADLDDVSAELRRLGETIEDDPDRLAVVRARRQLLRELRRKYGPTLADVVTFATTARARLAELEGHEARAIELETTGVALEAEIAALEEDLGRARQEAAPKLATQVETRLRELAMPTARFTVLVVGAAGEEVTFHLGANAGEPEVPLAKAASGGELARTMLALRLVTSLSASADERAPTLVFDEVDAGIGGEAALAVGRALAALAPSHQVLVVTHLPQVAAFADHQVVVRKEARGARTVAIAKPVSGDERVVELSRMLSGQPDSVRARSHAAELLAAAAAERTGLLTPSGA